MKNQKIVNVTKTVKYSIKLNPAVVAEWSKTLVPLLFIFAPTQKTTLFMSLLFFSRAPQPQ